MGAYYTKEDITEYISKNTVVPFLFDAAREKCKIAFEGQRSVWRLLQEDPDRYIDKAVRHGMSWNYRPKNVDKHEGEPIPRPLPLPPAIEEGVDPIKPNLLERRKPWNKSAPPNYALPTEIWREVVARRNRYEEVHGKLAAGEISSINDLITYNLDIRQFAQDVVENAEGPELLVAFWEAVEAVTVLDPTCGSGAFLFAALNILDPLYEACLERMRFFLNEWGEAGGKNHPNYFKLFTETLKRVEEHPNLRYFVLKSIIVNNLYGVDIMEEAVEICKLRLFLKLVAQIEHAKDIEPLPDIDFNIRAGNTLVGFTKLEEVRSAAEKESSGQGKIVFGETEEQIKRLKEEADIADRAFRKFREMQTQQGMSPKDFSEAKENLRSRLKKLTDELDQFLASEYGINEGSIPNKKKFEDAFEQWRKSHQPFHWFAEFYGILKACGFDVIIGNPPYVDMKDMKDYTVRGFSTIVTRNLYPLILERCLILGQHRGTQGYIVPVSAVATEGYAKLQHLLITRCLYYSSFDDRPAHLFDGLDKNTLSILLLSEKKGDPSLFSTRLCRWSAEERRTLFTLLQYVATPPCGLLSCFPKIGKSSEAKIWEKIYHEAKPLLSFYTQKPKAITYYSRKINAFLQILDFVPEVRDGMGKLRPPSEFKTLGFRTSEEAGSVFCCFNSTLFRWFVDVVTDGSHLNRREVDFFPFDPIEASRISELNALSQELSEKLRRNSETRVMRYKHDTLTIQCILPKKAKPIIDKIDRVLAQHYGFTEEELDLIINYDIKYRIGNVAEREDVTDWEK
jgi:hypothetical protein